MKKLLLFLTIISISIFLGNNKINANINNNFEKETVISNEVEYLEDGGYLVITTTEIISNITLFSNTYTKTGQKNVRKYNSNDEILWIYTLSASYTVNPGISASCVSTSYSTTINDSNWKFSDGNSYFSENIAYGEGLFKNKVLLITIQKVNIDITLTCDANGNLS